jgi:hypothetical protein
MLKQALLFLGMLSVNTSCIGERWDRYYAEVNCDRPVEMCVTRTDSCFYCESANEQVAINCMPTSWPYKKGDDPRLGESFRKIDELAYSGAGLVSITLLNRCVPKSE